MGFPSPGFHIRGVELISAKEWQNINHEGNSILRCYRLDGDRVDGKVIDGDSGNDDESVER
jgi:hypothetical protein